MVVMKETNGTAAAARPRQVTVAGVMAATACVLLVFTLFDSMANVRSADVRDEIADRLSRSPANGLGLEVASVVELLRGVVLLSGALAAAGAVLAVFTLQRHRGARIGLTVIAVLMLFSATLVAGILPILVAVAASLMWGREARDWFAGRAPRPAPDRPAPRAAEGPDAADPPAGAWPVTLPAAPAGDTADGRPGPSEQPFGVAPAAAGQHPYGPGPALPAGSTPSRPATVTVAVWLTWVFSGLVVLVFSLMVLVIVVDQAAVVEALQRSSAVADQELSSREILGGVWLLCAFSIAWALGAIALAVLVVRRVELARIFLLLSSALAALVCLLVVPVGWPHAVAAFTCVALLSRPATKAWFAGRDAGRPGPPAPQQPPPQPKAKPPVW